MPSQKRRGGAMSAANAKKRRVIEDPADDLPSVAPEPAVSSGVPEAAPAPTQDNEQLKALSRLLQGDLENVRHSLTCKICEKLFYEPFVLSCGHTYCYRCLSSWFSATRKPTCPNCRVTIVQPPAPSYVVKELVNIVCARAELLPDGETLEDHATWKQEEADFYIAEKAKPEGLFEGRFKERRRVIRDPSDGVERCPTCNWELEDGYCMECQVAYDSDGQEVDDNDYSFSSAGGDSDLDETDDIDAEVATMDHDPDFIPLDPAAAVYYDLQAREDHISHHLNAHRGALLANGRPSAGWFRPPAPAVDATSRTTDPRHWPHLPHLDSEEDEEDEEDEGSLEGFVVNDHISNTEESPITVSSESGPEAENTAEYRPPPWQSRTGLARRTIHDSDSESDDSEDTEHTQNGPPPYYDTDEGNEDSDSDEQSASSSLGGESAEVDSMEEGDYYVD